MSADLRAKEQRLNQELEEVFQQQKLLNGEIHKIVDEYFDEIIKALEDEWSRFSTEEAYDVENPTQREVGYLIGIRKAKKIVREKFGKEDK